MNDAQHAAYSAYLRALADLMALKDWQIELQREYPDDKGAWAEIEVCEQHDTAWVRVAWPEFFDVKSVEDRRAYLVHELVHCHLDRPQRQMQRLKDMFPENTATDFAQRQHRIDIEFATERLTRIIAPMMPLPPEAAA